MRVDAHQHFWRYDPAEYGWIGEGMEVLARTYLPADLAPHLDACGLDGSVAVQARQSLAENRDLLALADADARVLGVVGWVDLCSPDVEDELAEFAGDPRFVGVRHVVQDEPDDAFLLREDFGRGVARLAAHGLTYDVLIYPRQLPAAVEFVGRFPEQPMVLDHLAKPLAKAGEVEPWAAQMRALAAHPHLTCKLSGLATEADWSAWTPEGLARYLDHTLEVFGPSRVMFGSDWPVCRLAVEYERWYEVLDGWAGELSEDERAALFGGTCARFYGLGS